MLKLIIADDEHWVCQLIQNILPWKELGIEIAGIAYNGLEAFDLIRQAPPDIVITDIKMPGLNGLELIQKCKNIDEQISFILVSGHRDFEYAQNAIKHGADDYLLKPITKEDISQVIEKIRGKKKQLQQVEQESLQMQNELDRSRTLIREQFALQLLRTKGCVTKQPLRSMAEHNARSSTNFCPGSFLVIILKMDYVQFHLANRKFISHMIEKIAPILEKNLIPYCHDLLFSQTQSGIYGFLNLKGDPHHMRQAFSDLFDEILGVVKEFRDYPVTLAVGEAQQGIEDLAASFESAEMSLKTRIVKEPNTILYPDSHWGYKEMKRPLRMADMEQKLFDGIEQFNRYELEKGILAIFESLYDGQGNINPFVLYDAGETIIDLFLLILERIGIKNQVSGGFKGEALDQLGYCSTPELYRSRLVSLMTEHLSQLEESRRQMEFKPIRKAKEHIEQNYMLPISLDDLAEKVGLNPTYLSVLFKKETGSNYKDYLIQYRMKVAQRLLKESNDTIAQIAQLVGYKDTRHFSKTFDKVIGIKPNVYRKIYG